jgi:hypothetical protein
MCLTGLKPGSSSGLHRSFLAPVVCRHLIAIVAVAGALGVPPTVTVQVNVSVATKLFAGVWTKLPSALSVSLPSDGGAPAPAPRTGAHHDALYNVPE